MPQVNKDSPRVADAAKGALAGAAGVWAMDKATWFLWNREDPQALDQERSARPAGLDPAHHAVDQAAEAFDIELERRQPNAAGKVMHYAIGILPAAAYGALRSRRRTPSLGRGLMFGLGLFILHDEIANPLLGLAGSPDEYPWQAHGRGLIGHLVFGAVTEAALALVDRAL